MPTPINPPFVGAKHSESTAISVVGGDELVLGIRPQAADPTKFENINIPVALLGTNPTTPGGSLALTLNAAQALPTMPPPAPRVDGGTRYAITGPWNGGPTRTVYVDGLNATTYASTGWAYDSGDVLQPVKVNVAAGTVDTEELRGLWAKQYGEVDPTTGTVDLWVGPAATLSAIVRVVVAP